MIRKYYHKIITAFLGMVFLISLQLNAQKDTLKEKSYYQTFNLSYIVGGQIYNDNFLYNQGYSCKTSFGKKINSDISIGLGTGCMLLTNEGFIPVYIDILGRKKNKDNAPFIKFQGGYSFGWNNSSSSNQHYKINGGLFINAGLGRMIKANEKFSFLFYWSYCHQFAEMEYEIFGENSYSEILNYDMLHISIGLLFE